MQVDGFFSVVIERGVASTKVDRLFSIVIERGVV